MSAGDVRTFPLDDVLSAITGRLLRKGGVDGLYGVLNWMTGVSLYTHQLPRASDAAKPFLLETFLEFVAPVAALEDAIAAGADPAEACRAFADAAAEQHGATLDVPRLPPGAYRPMDPLAELEQMAPGKPVLVVALK